MNGGPNTQSMPPMMSRSTGANEVLRAKNKRRDDQIRKKVDQELTRRTNARRSSTLLNPKPKHSIGTVSSLKPAAAIIIIDSAKIIQAAQLMAAKRTDAVLVVSEQGDLVGILTDKDIAFRVVAEGLDVRMTSVSDVMTSDPIAVYDKGSRNEALNIMISRRFRHLPVISEGDEANHGTSVVGLLDITKCVFERLDDLERKVNEDQSIISAMELMERRGTVHSDRVDSLKNNHGCPDISSVLLKGDHPDDFPSVSVKASVREAAKIMKRYHSTAILATGTPDGEAKIGGIFTTKDIVLRVIAASLDPNTTSIIRVMALKKLHVGNFLHLPVIDDTIPVGLVDVMTLTIAMLTYLVSSFSNKMSKNGGSPEESEGPMWNTFWNSTFSAGPQLDSDARSVNESRSGIPSSVHYRDRESMSRLDARTESVASLQNEEFNASVVHNLSLSRFAFKLKDMTLINGKVFRFSSDVNSLMELYSNVASKTGYKSQLEDTLDITTLTGIRARICYLDDDNDTVNIESDKDVQEAVKMSISMNAKRLVIYLGDPPSQILIPEIRASSHTSRVATPFIPETQAEVVKDLGVFESMKDAPVVVNVAASAGICIVAFYIMMRIAKM